MKLTRMEGYIIVLLQFNKIHKEIMKQNFAFPRTFFLVATFKLFTVHIQVFSLKKWYQFPYLVHLMPP